MSRQEDLNRAIDNIVQGYSKKVLKRAINKYDELPTASDILLGQIVQYTGETNSSYTRGYLYECVLNGATYNWSRIDVQPSGRDNIATDTDLGLIKVGEGLQITAGGLLSVTTKVILSRADVPLRGEANVLYVDMINKEISVWDEEISQYVRVSSDYNDIAVINGGGALVT